MGLFFFLSFHVKGLNVKFLPPGSCCEPLVYSWRDYVGSLWTLWDTLSGW